jgi:phage shock protein E
MAGKYWFIGIGVLAGAIGGFLYWNYIGCTTGTCPITSVWYRSTLYGAFLGGTLGFSFFNKKENKMNSYKNLDADNFSAVVQGNSDAILIDVRTPMEFKNGHVPGAINVDMLGGELGAKIKTMDKTKSYYLYCRSGGRSAVAASEMVKNGFEKVFNLSHGIGSLRNIEFVK